MADKKLSGGDPLEVIDSGTFIPAVKDGDLKNYKIPAANLGDSRMASANGISGSGDKTTQLNTALAKADVKEIVFDKGDYTVSGTVNGNGKKLIFINNSRLIGAGIVDNVYIDADTKKQIFATTIGVTNVQNDEVSAAWFGAKAEAEFGVANGTDNLPIVTKALNCFGTDRQRCRVYIPARKGKANPRLGFHYFFSGPLQISRPVELYGDGKTSTSLIFPTTSGLILNFPTSPCYFHDFSVRGNFGGISSTANTGTRNGVEVKSAGSVFEKILAESFDGNGWSIVADVGGSTNANITKFIECDAVGNGKNGMYFQGGDSNACIIQGGTFESNAQCGIKDESFLGNTFLAVHTASNGHTHNFNKAIVKYDDKYYACIQQNSAIEPVSTPGWQSFWYLMDPFSPVFWTDWDGTSTFYPTGGLVFKGPNQQGIAIGCYSEYDQPPTRTERTLIIGGFSASSNIYNLYASDKGITGNDAIGVLDVYLKKNIGLFFDLQSASLANGISKGNKSLEFRYLGSDQTSAYILTAGTNGFNGSATINGLLGRDNNHGGRAWFAADEGFLCRVLRAPDVRHRLLGLSMDAPNEWHFGQGDVMINTLAGSPIIAYRCKTASVGGNGGTWEALSGRIYVSPPTSSTAAGTVGQFSFDANYYYEVIATNTWKRVAWDTTSW